MYRPNLGDITLSFAVFFQIAILMLQELLMASNIIEHESFRMISIILSALPMIPAIYFIIKRNIVLSLISYFIVILLILLSIVFFPDNGQYIFSESFSESGAFYLLCINVPSFLCIASIRNVDNLRKVLLIVSYVILALGIIYCDFLWTGNISFSRYSMTLSYYLLVPAVVFLSQKKIFYLILFIIICILMLMLGSRGALVTAVIYSIVFSFIDSKNRKLIIPGLIVIIIISGSLISLLFTLSYKTGVSSRTLNMLLEGNYADSSGRYEIYTATWRSILDSPIWGHGIFGDRVLLKGIYCHNIIFEMFHNFGLLFGTGLVLLLTYKIIRTLLNSNHENKNLLLMFLCYSLVPFMVSSSYLVDPKFGLLVGSLFMLSNNIDTVNP